MRLQMIKKGNLTHKAIPLRKLMAVPHQKERSTDFDEFLFVQMHLSDTCLLEREKKPWL